MTAVHIPHDPKNPAWWEQQARDLRARASKARQVDSIVIFLKEAEDCERSAAKLRCRAEWDNVNDPPCHPSDKGWQPCKVCAPA